MSRSEVNNILLRCNTSLCVTNASFVQRLGIPPRTAAPAHCAVPKWVGNVAGLAPNTSKRQTRAMQTAVWPDPMKPSWVAAPRERSSMRPLTNGPRSLMRTTTLRPLFLLVTLSLVPNGKLRWAAVNAAGFMRSPEAVLECRAYQEARPHSAAAEEAVEAPAVRPAAIVTATS